MKYKEYAYSLATVVFLFSTSFSCTFKSILDDVEIEEYSQIGLSELQFTSQGQTGNRTYNNNNQEVANLRDVLLADIMSTIKNTGVSPCHEQHFYDQ